MAYPIPPDQLQEIRKLFDQGVPSLTIAQQFGIPVGSIVAQRANQTWERNQGGGSGVSVEIEEAITTTFGLEKDLQQALRANIGQLEDGLRITDGGKERKVTSGFIDITAEDSDGRTVVIELKADEADKTAIGQILSYMGDLGDVTDAPVRGILVAAGFSTSAISASRAVPNVELSRYRFQFSFQLVKNHSA